MTRRWRKLGLVCVMLLMAACNQQQAVPTRTPTPTTEPTTAVPSPTQLQRATLPPTWTPIHSYTPSLTPTPTLTFTPSQTFTPSKTFTPSQTFTPSNTPTPNATNQFLVSQPLTPECNAFGPDSELNMRSFTLGTEPTVAWTPVDSATAYVLRLYNENLVTLLTETLTETTYTFPADLFPVLGASYAWDVAPIDADGEQICPTRGSLLYPTG